MYRIKCLKCNDILESRHRHDFVQCKCGECYVDGGNDPYVRIGGDLNYIVEVKDDGTEVPIKI